MEAYGHMMGQPTAPVSSDPSIDHGATSSRGRGRGLTWGRRGNFRKELLKEVVEIDKNEVHDAQPKQSTPSRSWRGKMEMSVVPEVASDENESGEILLDSAENPATSNPAISPPTFLKN